MKPNKIYILFKNIYMFILFAMFFMCDDFNKTHFYP